jgi:hypothetical protein
MNMSLIIWSVVFGSVGLGFFVYGKKQAAFVPLICGIVLMVLPYFVSDTVPLVATGVVLMALPYFVKV